MKGGGTMYSPFKEVEVQNLGARRGIYKGAEGKVVQCTVPLRR